MTLVATKRITPHERKIVESYVNGTEWQEWEYTFSWADFQNGFRMDLICVEEEDDYSHIEAVLFNEDGEEVAVSEPFYEFIESASLNYDGNTYVLNVEEFDIQRRSQEDGAFLEWFRRRYGIGRMA